MLPKAYILLVNLAYSIVMVAMSNVVDVEIDGDMYNLQVFTDEDIAKYDGSDVSLCSELEEFYN